MIGRVARIGFWTSVATLAYGIAGFPAILAARAAVRRCPVPDSGAPVPLTVVMAAHQEAAVIADKVRDTAALDYPAGMLDMVIGCDGCTDGTAERAREAAAGCGLTLRVVEVPRGGKNAALRAALAHAHGEAVLFTDADARLAPDAARRLVATLGDPAVGGASGRVRFRADGAAHGERAHWSIEDRLRGLQTASGSMTSAAGPLYLTRRALVSPPPDGVTDDFWISAHVSLSGRRLVFVPEAVAELPPPPGARGEFRRKVRIINRGLTGVWGARRAMRLRWIDVQVVTHKALRRLLPIPAAVAVVCGLLLSGRGRVYRVVGFSGAAFTALAAAGWRLRDTPAGRHPALAVPAFIGSTAVASVAALRALMRGERHVWWTPPPPPPSS